MEGRVDEREVKARGEREMVGLRMERGYARGRVAFGGWV